MKNFILTMLFALVAITMTNAQTIETKKIPGGVKFYQDGYALDYNQMKTLMESNKEAYQLISKAKSNNGIASVFGFIGGGLVGWPIGTKIGGGEPNWTLAGIGAGLIVVSLAITSGATKNATKAVDIYNAELSFIGHKAIPQVNFISKGNQIGISVKF